MSIANISAIRPNWLLPFENTIDLENVGQHGPHVVNGGKGEIAPRPLVLLPFPNNLELVNTPWHIFKNINWLLDGA